MRLSDLHRRGWRVAPRGLLDGPEDTSLGAISRIRRDDLLADGRSAGGAGAKPFAIEPRLSGAKRRTLAPGNPRRDRRA